MGGPGGRGPSVPKTPRRGRYGGRAPVGGVAEDRKAGTRGVGGDVQSLPLLSTPLVFFADCLLVGSYDRWDPLELSLLMGGSGSYVT
jgi:hypothetical protein